VTNLPYRKERRVTTMQLYQVDAFADDVFQGNQAAVCPLDTWLGDGELQAIAEENNLPATAYFVPSGGCYQLRWFTPRTELDLCGHATLASAFVIFSVLGSPADRVRFETKSGELMVSREGNRLAMDLPAHPPSPSESPPQGLLTGLPGVDPREILRVDRKYILVVESEDAVRAVKPNFSCLEQLGGYGVAVTAASQDVDFVSRYFHPAVGVPEDSVTGSLHCSLVPYWAKRLGKTQLHARQVSRRQGDLWCEDRGDRVSLAGRAALYLQGTISVPDRRDGPLPGGVHPVAISAGGKGDRV
jgi:PhzF family phenazine biosynthesis protein